MSNCVNQIFLLGAAGKDPEIRVTTGGMTVASFSIATSEGKKDAQGNWKDDTQWHNVKAFGRTAETVKDQVKKGTRVFLEGKLTTESWDDKVTGQKRYKAVVIANYLSVVPSARSCGAGAENTAATAQRRTADQVQQSTEITDDDIPF